MLIGVPKEVKNHEYRVGLTPGSVRELVHFGHQVLVQSRAGAGIRETDDDYRSAGAEIVETPEEIYARAQMIVKVKEPQPKECAMLRPDQVLFTYLHLAPDPDQVRDLVRSGAIAIAYETVSSPTGELPLLAPMSEIAGRMAVQVAAHFLERPSGGCGVLISGATGLSPARIVVLGAGVVGSNAARIAAGFGADVAMLSRSAGPLQRLQAELGPRLRAFLATPEDIDREVRQADAVIGSAMVPGGLAPKLVTRAMLATMKKGAVLVDVSIDQGGCFETSRPTTHADPVYAVDGVLHYCVANMPGAVPRTSTYALSRATLPFVLELAQRGVLDALRQNAGLRDGLNICRGKVTRREVAEALGYPLTQAQAALAA
jgi:alanine dehydrogenase